MCKKRQFNLSIPEQLAVELNRLTATVGKKQKWLVPAAALLCFLEQPEEVQQRYLDRVNMADLLGDFRILKRPPAAGAPGRQQRFDQEYVQDSEEQEGLGDEGCTPSQGRPVLQAEVIDRELEDALQARHRTSRPTLQLDEDSPTAKRGIPREVS